MGTVKKAAAPKQLSGRYERKKMRERKTDAARTLLMISDQVSNIRMYSHIMFPVDKFRHYGLVEDPSNADVFESQLQLYIKKLLSKINK